VTARVRWFAFIGSLVAILGIGVLDVVTGPLPDLTVLYLIPIGVATVVLGQWAGLSVVALAFLVEVVPLLREGVHPVGLVLFDGVTHLLVRGLAVVALDRVLSQLAEIRGLKAERDFDLDLAARVHAALFTPPETARPELAIGQRMEFLRELGGDYVHYVDTADGLFLCVGDIAGKGASAALFTSVLDRALSEAIVTSTDVATVVKTANARLEEALPDDRFVTLVAVLIDDSSITYANAGHEPPLMYRGGGDGRVVRLDGAGSMPLGIAPEIEVSPESLGFSAGDVLLIVTDGVTESPPFMRSGKGRLEKLLQDAAPVGAQHVADAVFDAAHGHGSQLRDDVLVVTIERKNL
jgi:serine phosphatase RsbU (regulator of sigma subunit)